MVACSDREKFLQHKEKWIEDTCFMSSIQDKLMHLSYQTIIGMGKDALPLIFEDLEKELQHWFWALRAITEADPVPKEYAGRMQKMREYWLGWWKENKETWT